MLKVDRIEMYRFCFLFTHRRTMTYLWVFGFTMELKLKKVLPKVIHQGCVPRNKVLSSDTGSSFQADNELRFNQRHCSVSPDVVRSEAEGHRLDFNFKIKRVLFQSFICAYYVGFIPMRFSKVSCDSFITVLFQSIM